MSKPSHVSTDYKCIKTIGRGNFGVISLVEHIPDHRRYVLKTIAMNELSESEREGCVLEVKLLSELKHPLIVTYKTSFLEGDNLYIIMHYCENGDLTNAIKNRTEPFEERQIMVWFVQIALALQHCHHRKIIHRDLKSKNIFLTQKNNIRLGDFGIARVLNATSEMAMTVVGTPYSMSPEVCENKPYSFKSDIWALGCVLYELCVLKHAFDANNLLGLVWKIVQENYPPIPDIYSEELRDLVNSMLQKDPDKRPTIDEIVELPIVTRMLQEQIQAQTSTIQQTKQQEQKTKTNSTNTSTTITTPSTPLNNTNTTNNINQFDNTLRNNKLTKRNTPSQDTASTAPSLITPTVNTSSSNTPIHTIPKTTSPPLARDIKTASYSRDRRSSFEQREQQSSSLSSNNNKQQIKPNKERKQRPSSSSTRNSVLERAKKRKEEEIARRTAELNAQTRINVSQRVTAKERVSHEFHSSISSADSAIGRQNHTPRRRIQSASYERKPERYQSSQQQYDYSQQQQHTPRNTINNHYDHEDDDYYSDSSSTDYDDMGYTYGNVSNTNSPVRNQPQQQQQANNVVVNNTPVSNTPRTMSWEDKPIKSTGRYSFDPEMSVPYQGRKEPYSNKYPSNQQNNNQQNINSDHESYSDDEFDEYQEDTELLNVYLKDSKQKERTIKQQYNNTNNNTKKQQHVSTTTPRSPPKEKRSSFSEKNNQPPSVKSKLAAMREKCLRSISSDDFQTLIDVFKIIHESKNHKQCELAKKRLTCEFGHLSQDIMMLIEHYTFLQSM